MGSTPLDILKARPWATNTQYRGGIDIVSVNGYLVMAQADHISGTYVTDVGAGLWKLYAQAQNKWINGGLDFWQRGTTSSLSSSTGAAYLADRLQYNVGGTNRSITASQSSSLIPTLAQSKYQSSYSYQFTMNAAASSFAAGDYIMPLLYPIEGQDYASMHGQQVTLSFWFYATVPGTYSLSLRNASVNRNYTTTFTQSFATTWQFQAITLTLDSAGTWAFDNTAGMYVVIGAVTGSTYQASTLNAWQNGNFLSASTATNWMATNGAQINVTQIMLNLGPAPSPVFQRAAPTIQAELGMCQRYYSTSIQSGYTVSNFPAGSISGNVMIASGINDLAGTVQFPVPLRAAPTSTFKIYSSNNRTLGSVRDTTTGTDVTISSYPTSPTDKTVCWFLQGSNGFTTGRAYSFQWTADAEL